MRQNSAVLIVLAMLVGLIPIAALGVGEGITINEIRINQPGADTDEYFELTGEPGASLDGHTYIVIGDGTGGSGVIEAVVDLAGLAFDTNGFFVAAESTFRLGTADLTTTLNFENSDNVTHVLVTGFTGGNGNDLDTDDDGTLDATPWSSVVDSVAVIGTDVDGEEAYSTTTVGPDGTFVPGHAFDCSQGWEIGAFDPVGGDDIPGLVNVCDVAPPPPVEVLVHDVQGPGAATPLAGVDVIIEGVIVGDFQDLDADQLGGFFVQEEPGDQDNDPDTSEGIFVFAPFAPDVNVGDVVRVTGTATEFFAKTEITDVTEVEIKDPDLGSVIATPVSLPVAAVSDFEPVEGMLVTFGQDLFISEFFNFDRFGEIVLTTVRQFQGTHVAEPGDPANAVALANGLARITLDDGRDSQNPDPAVHPNGEEFTLTNTFRGGDILQNVTGVMDFAFGCTESSPLWAPPT